MDGVELGAQSAATDSRSGLTAPLEEVPDHLPVRDDDREHTHRALADALQPYQSSIIVTLLVIFATMITSTVVLDAVNELS